MYWQLRIIDSFDTSKTNRKRATFKHQASDFGKNKMLRKKNCEEIFVKTAYNLFKSINNSIKSRAARGLQLSVTL